MKDRLQRRGPRFTGWLGNRGPAPILPWPAILAALFALHSRTTFASPTLDVGVGSLAMPAPDLSPVAEGGTGPVGQDTGGTIAAVYAVQVGAFTVSENAEKLVELLRSKGIEAVVHDNLIDGRTLLHLVWVGRFEKATDAIIEIRRIEDLTGIRGVLREQMIWRRR